jgi:hypothetical protein
MQLGVPKALQLQQGGVAQLAQETRANKLEGLNKIVS